MKTLGELGVGLPTNEEGVKSTVEELKTKLSFYKDNQVRVTQEVKEKQVQGEKRGPPPPPPRVCVGQMLMVCVG
jgi:hypothetical protein